MNKMVVVIHDDPSLRNLLAEILAAWKRHEMRVETLGYASRLPGPMKRWIEEADIFVLGLERHYDEGRCAEGADVAESLFKLGRKVLVVGSECSAGIIGVPFYWDLGSERHFLEVVGEVLDSPGPSSTERARFMGAFTKRRGKPVGHGEKIAST